jgi:hypothetical protein
VVRGFNALLRKILKFIIYYIIFSVAAILDTYFMANGLAKSQEYIKLNSDKWLPILFQNKNHRSIPPNKLV